MCIIFQILIFINGAANVHADVLVAALILAADNLAYNLVDALLSKPYYWPTRFLSSLFNPPVVFPAVGKSDGNDVDKNTRFSHASFNGRLQLQLVRRVHRPQIQ